MNDRRDEKNMKESGKKEVIIEAPKFETVKITIVGESKMVLHKFSQKAREQIKQKQLQGSRSSKGKKHKPKDFDALYKGALYVSKDGWYGFPASAIRNAMISACRATGFQMTKTKLAVFVLHDGFDVESGTPLVRIRKGEPYPHEDYVRLENGVTDINVRPMWDEGWEAVVTLRYDADMFSMSDTINLLHRAGLQVGIGEGRPSSRKSCGVGWGTFTIKQGE